MSKIRVSIVNSTTLRLEQKGDIGDIIDLNEVQELDITPILEVIKNKKDEVYNTLLTKEILQQEAFKKIALNELEKKLKLNFDSLRIDKENLEASIKAGDKIKKSEIEAIKAVLNASFTSEKNKLEFEIKKLLSSLDEQKRIAVLETEKEKDAQLNAQKSDYDSLLKDKENEIRNIKQKRETDIKLKSLEVEKLYIESIAEKDSRIVDLSHTLEDKEKEIKIKINEIDNEYKEQINTLENEIKNIQREKALRNVKQIGENLENWCNEKYKDVSLYGFKTCTWNKDNTAVQGDDQKKATKGDYIFKVFNNLESKTLLTSAMCEMKSEATESENKKKNSSHYDKLDKDRRNKNLDYAILISELEYNFETDAPIFAVKEYDKMYVVRPQYFLTLLGIIESIGIKYSKLITDKEIEKIKFEDANKIISDFEKFKTNLLDNSLKHINTNLNEISKKADNIRISADDIIKHVVTIVDNHLRTVQNKISNYSIHSVIRKIDKLDE